MRSLSRASLLPILSCLLLAACGEDAESAGGPVARRADARAADPWERIPPDSLYGATAVENLRTVPVEIDAVNIPAGWDGMRIAAVSDLNLGNWPDNEEVAAAAIRRAVESNADLIVLLGDYVAGARDTAALARVLAPLRGRQALAVLGDRDIGSDSLEAVITRTLGGAGVRVLKNDAVPITREGGTAFVAGVDPDITDLGFGDREYILATLGGGAATPILLAHNPLLAAAAPEDRFAAILAGNTFCGSVEVPGTPRLSWLRGEGLPGAAVPGVDRLFRLDGNTMFVTCGVGYTFLPARLGSPPEVALVTLRSVAPEEPVAAPDPGVPDSLLQRFQRQDTTG
jgi:predicted MPP superfamily phosphohydrolase